MKVLILILMIMTTQSLTAQDLEKYRWKNRIVLLFAPIDENAGISRQIRELETDLDGLKERDLIIFLIDRVQVLELLENEFTSLSAGNLRKKYLRNGEGFHYILIGKDGGVKLDRRTFVSNNDLFEIIDAMPMRRQEMREKNSKN